MRRFVLTFAGLILIALGIWFVMVVPTTSEKVASIVDWYPEREGLVLTLNVNGKLYKCYTNATFIYVNKSVEVVFEDELPALIKQNGWTFKVLKWKELKTLENMPKVR